MELSFSFIIPVFNRPGEIKELLESLVLQTYKESFEVVIVEDGSTLSSEEVVIDFQERLDISYYKKKNSGPGDSRNYGMRMAKGNYYIVLDSDCTIPSQYLANVTKSLQEQYVHCYGGPDAAHSSFSLIQKAINYTMTSILTTGGIRGSKKAVDKFQPRSFNMGISKVAFETVGGYGNIHPGEDPDLTFRLWEKGFETKLISEAFVFHKRRINWLKFYKQVHKFGMVRPILNKWHPQTAKSTYWFPSLFCLGFLLAIGLYFRGISAPIWFYAFYFILIFVDALLKNRSIAVALLSLVSLGIQFYGYGFGFLKSTISLTFSRKKPEEIFPKLFFKPNAAV
jgi:glycosyltransferase involved in cell wall biosynthesis